VEVYIQRFTFWYDDSRGTLPHVTTPVTFTNWPFLAVPSSDSGKVAMKLVMEWWPQKEFHVRNSSSSPKRLATTINRMGFCTAATMKAPAINPMANKGMTIHRITLGNLFLNEELEVRALLLRLLMAGLMGGIWTAWYIAFKAGVPSQICLVAITLSCDPDTRTALLPAAKGDEVMSPVAGSTAGDRGPEKEEAPPEDFTAPVSATCCCRVRGPEVDRPKALVPPPPPAVIGPDCEPMDLLWCQGTPAELRGPEVESGERLEVVALEERGPEWVEEAATVPPSTLLLLLPDFNDAECMRPAIFPSSPDFLTSPPV
jgi:hypothetical protein